MGKRTNTARWTGKMWRIDVQQNGKRNSFYSSRPGRAGQREANAKADAWLDDGIAARAPRVADAGKLWLHEVEQTTCTTNYRPTESRWRNWIVPAIGSRRVNQLTDQDLQEIINTAYAAGRSRKVLKLLAADLRAFCKYCRKARLSAYVPEELKIPAGARYKGKTILQPSDLVKLFNVDTTTYRGKTVEDEYINAYRFQVLTGLRPGEVIGLDWADIHGSMVNVSRSVNVEGEQTRGKNENAVRSFQLSALACHVLDEQREASGGLGSVFRITNEQHYYKRWRTYCAANGLTPCSLYELRHTFVSVVKTLPAGEVKSLVGHSADMDTFGIYAHTLTGDAAHTAQAVNGVFLQVLKMHKKKRLYHPHQNGRRGASQGRWPPARMGRGTALKL